MTPRRKNSEAVDQERQSFTGFGPKALQFFHELAMHNDREWFQDNKLVYEKEVQQPMAALITSLVGELARRGIPLTGIPKRSMFRIHRDVRFSNDKSPYKTQAGAVLTHDGTKNSQGLLYIHVSPEGSFTAAGFYHPEPAQLEAIRRAIAAAPERFLAVEKALQKVRLTLSQGEALKRLPRGFEDFPAGPTAEILKLKSFVVHRDLSEASLARPRLVKEIADFAEEALPLLKFGWAAPGSVRPTPHPRQRLRPPGEQSAPGQTADASSDGATQGEFALPITNTSGPAGSAESPAECSERSRWARWPNLARSGCVDCGSGKIGEVCSEAGKRGANYG